MGARAARRRGLPASKEQMLYSLADTRLFPGVGAGSKYTSLAAGRRILLHTAKNAGFEMA
jgi:hypothetical protein